MEEQTQEMERGKQKSLDELQQELDEAKKEAQKNSRFRVIMPGKTAILNFTGKVYERTARINDAEAIKLDFELQEKTSDGINKVFSVSNKSATARALVTLLKSGKLTLSISREGEGLATRYRVSEVEQ
jgi:hypothetical protein